MLTGDPVNRETLLGALLVARLASAQEVTIGYQGLPYKATGESNTGIQLSDGLLLHAGRFDISNMMPGDVRKVAFTFDVQQPLADPEATLTLSVGDRDLREFVTEKVKIPIEAPVALAHGGTRAFYRPSTDSIVLPLFETFRDAVA